MDRERITSSDPFSPIGTDVEIMVGDHLLNLAHRMAVDAYSQTLNQRDLMEPGRKLHVEVSVIM